MNEWPQHYRKEQRPHKTSQAAIESWFYLLPEIQEYANTYVIHGATPSPWDTHGSISSSSGHSFSLPIGNCLMVRVLVRLPFGDVKSKHVLEHGLHSDHSDTWHSLVITQDWKVIGNFSCWQKLKRESSKILRKCIHLWIPLSALYPLHHKTCKHSKYLYLLGTEDYFVKLTFPQCILLKATLAKRWQEFAHKSIVRALV